MRRPRPLRLAILALALLSTPSGSAAARTRGAGDCVRCHPAREQAFVHGPVAVGQCAACHGEHRNGGRSQLVAQGPQLCFRCHEPKRFAAPGRRGAAHAGRCTGCHEPHGGSRRFFVRGGALCRRCHGAPGGSVHAEAAAAGRDAECLRCHNAHRGERAKLLLRGVPRAARCTARAQRATPPRLARH